MQDRHVQYPARFRLTPVEGTKDIVDLDSIPGTIYNEGTDLNKSALLKDTTAQMYGLNPATAVPDDIFRMLSKQYVDYWTPEIEFHTPGAVNWVAPDYNQGRPYPIGFFVIGAGGGGGISQAYYNYGGAIAHGGAGGYIVKGVSIVTPGTTYSGVVGTGGNGGIGKGRVPPTAGGASAMFGLAAGGGGGGSFVDTILNENAAQFAIGMTGGGQPVPAMVFFYLPGTQGWYAPVGGQTVPSEFRPSSSSSAYGTWLANIWGPEPGMAFNPFTLSTYPVAYGGGIKLTHDSATFTPQALAAGGGAGAANLTEGGTGSTATAAGCGGGAAWGKSYSDGKHIGGNGAAGGIYLYKRGKY